MKIVMMLLFLGAAAAGFAENALESQAKAFQPPADQANLYVARKSETFGALVGFQVLIDGTPVAELKGGTFAFARVPPGTHKIEIHAGISAVSVEVKAAAGKNVFYETGAKPNTALLQPEISLVLLEPLGKLMVSQSKLAPGAP